MQTRYLLPHRYKKVGWFLFWPFLVLGGLQLYFEWEPDWLDATVLSLLNFDFIFEQETHQAFELFKLRENNLADEIVAVFLLTGCVFLLLAREKQEDEFLMKIRLESLLWAAIVNAFITLFSILFIYEFQFLYVMIYNLFLLFVLFIFRFQWKLYTLKKQTHDQ